MFTQGQFVSVITNAYDVTGTLVAQGGDTYPVTFGTDTAGRGLTMPGARSGVTIDTNAYTYIKVNYLVEEKLGTFRE